MNDIYWFDLLSPGEVGWLGQERNGAATREEMREGFSNIEKIMLAGVLISGAGLFWQISRSL
jgi:hypothetical protein